MLAVHYTDEMRVLLGDECSLYTSFPMRTGSLYVETSGAERDWTGDFQGTRLFEVIDRLQNSVTVDVYLPDIGVFSWF